MLTIDWPGTDAEGWTDYIPMEWFAKIGRFDSLSHSIHKLGKRPLLAKLSIDVREYAAILNYCGADEAFNKTHDIEVGLIEIRFRDLKRQSIDSLWWKDAETDPNWVDAEAAYGFTGDGPIGADEGGKRLAIHMRSERKPWLAMEKKEQAKDPYSGHLACEACGPALNDTYVPEIAFDIYEVHHRKPVSEGPQRVTLADLAILCPNCYRAIHRTKPMMSVEDFRGTLRKF